jgi:3-oxoacyl-[acyl-carrier-protein] synthase II
LIADPKRAIMLSGRRVVITGVGAVTCLGTDARANWRALLEGRSGIGPITRFDVASFAVRFAGEVREFNPEKWIDPREVARIDRYAQFAIAATQEAVEQSGIDWSKLPPDRCGVSLGSGIGGLESLEEQHTLMIQKGRSKTSPYLIPKMMANSAAGLVSIRFGLTGPNIALATACASAHHSMGEAFRIIQRGEADVMLAGGAEATITPIGIGGFASMRALSTRNDDPQGASRPFDKDRDGFVVGEGAGMLVFEEYEAARKRGAKILAELKGYGLSGDGHHITAPDPEGTGASKAMSDAIRDAGIPPEQVAYVNAHGTSTPMNDRIETLAIKRVFGDHAKKLAVSSTKSMIGHLLGASGGVGLVFSVLSLIDGKVHPTINYRTPDPDCDLDYVPNAARDLKVSAVLVNSFGFGGHNASLLVCKI